MTNKMSGKFFIISLNKFDKWWKNIFFFYAFKDFLNKIVKSLLSFVSLMNLKDLCFLIRQKIVKSKEKSFRPNIFLHLLNNLFVINCGDSSHIKVWFPLLCRNISPNTFIKSEIIWLLTKYMIIWQNFRDWLKEHEKMGSCLFYYVLQKMRINWSEWEFKELN